MENDFYKSNSKSLGNMGNPIKNYDFSKVLANFLYASLSRGTVLIRT